MAAKREVSRAVEDRRIKATDMMLNALEAFEGELSDWEKGFVGSLTDWFYMQGKPLTGPQYEHLEKVYRRFF